MIHICEAPINPPDKRFYRTIKYYSYYGCYLKNKYMFSKNKVRSLIHLSRKMFGYWMVHNIFDAKKGDTVYNIVYEEI